MAAKKDKYPQVGPKDWMNQHGWYAEKGGYKPQQGVLPQIMPGMYPGNLPVVMNQQATEPVYMDVPAYTHGGYHARPGYFYNGQHMVKNSGAGTYSQDGYYFMNGGAVHPTYTVGGNYDTSMPGTYTGSVPQSAAMDQVACQQYGGMQYGMSGGYGCESDLNNYQMKKGGIHIKPSMVGSLHRHLGIPEGEKIPASKLSIKPGDSPAIRKKKQFAINAKKWHHEEGGYVDNDGDIDEMKKGGWIKGAIKHPGRCTPGSPNYDCPKGSPQWNLAQRFKHGDLHKEYGGPVNPFNALRQFASGGGTDPWGQGAFAGTTDPQVQEGRDAQEQHVEQETGMQPVQTSDNNQRAPLSSQYAAKPGEEGQMQDASGFDDPAYGDADAQEEYNAGTKKKRGNGALNWGSAILGAGTGILGAASILHDNYSNRKTQQQWMRDQNKSDNLPRYINPMSKGQYDQQGNIPYNNMSNSPNIRTMKEGGYVKGQEVELSEQEISALLKKGYTLKRL